MKKHLNKSMVDFVKDQENEIKLLINHAYYVEVSDISWKIIKYANALSQTPRLGHFIPCDENDVPLEKPKNYEAWLRKALNTPYDADLSKYEKYQQACERVLFEGITQENGLVFLPNKQILHQSKLGKVTFEQILIYNLPLTEAGAKFFGL